MIKQDFKHEHTILDYLVQAAYPVPKLIPALDGSTIISRNNKYYVVFEYIDGYHPMHFYYFRGFHSSRILGLTGKSLGKLHALLKNFESTKSTRERESLGTGKHYREMNWYYKQLESCRTKMGEFTQSGISNRDKPRDKLRLNIDLIKSALIYTTELVENAKLDILHIHGDFGLSNILMRRDAPLYVIDLELSHLNWKLHDLAYFLNDFAYNNRYFNHSAESIFLEEYNKEFPISDEEIKIFPYLRLHSVLQRLSAYSYLYYTCGKRREFKIARGQRSIAQMLISNLPELSDIRLTSEEFPHNFFSFGWSKNRKLKYPAPLKNRLH